jgi:arginyl-tRNA synthetase
VYYTLAKRFQGALEEFIRQRYSVEAEVAVSRPPRLDLGEIASPVCLQLARQLKRAPRQIAEEVAAEIGPTEGIARIEIAGAGYLNAFLDRAAFWQAAQRESAGEAAAAVAKRPGKVIVEHTSINPNKAAHIGHVRNAVLGDTMARILRRVGQSVQIQNYIDNTGVQVADVVIGFLRMERRTPIGVKMLAREPKFDYL